MSKEKSFIKIGLIYCNISIFNKISTKLHSCSLKWISNRNILDKINFVRIVNVPDSISISYFNSENVT